MNKEEILSFLKALYGALPGGAVSVNWFEKGQNYPDIRWFYSDQLDEMAEFIVKTGKTHNTYISVNPRKQAMRGNRRGEAEDILAVVAAYQDFDIRGPAHAEKQLPETKEELLAFIDSLELKPSIIVFSGNGIHAYWLLIEPEVVGNNLRDISEALKNWERRVKTKAYAEHGWKFDSVSDLPRMLRAPGTMNFKTDPPSECRVIEMNGPRYRLSDFGEAGGTSVPQEIDDDEEAFAEMGRGSAEEMISRCRFLQHCRDDAATLPEPQWYAALSNLCLALDGQAAAHKISSPYPKYSYAETQRKYRHAVREDKPVTCEYIRNNLHFDCGRDCGVKCPVGLIHDGIRAGKHENSKPIVWEDPIPFSMMSRLPFPADALPYPYSEFAQAVAETTQTPVDLAGSSMIGILAACLQHKYVIRIKPDWTEQLNEYEVHAAEPSERKSAVLHFLTAPLNKYEISYNQEHSADVERSQMQKRILRQKQKAIEDKAAKGNADEDAVEQVAREIAAFHEVLPMKLFVDDITTEKLVSVMAENGGHMALISSEGGIFDTLAGLYSKNVNIDVFLKAYSGDPIRVDRIGRQSEVIADPALTIDLMVQPEVIAAALSNNVFRGRGLTARFLYCMPETQVGERKFVSKPIGDDLYAAYERAVINLLQDEYPEKPEIITLSPEAFRMITEFAEDLEPKIVHEYKDIAHWAGKLTGHVARIAGLLCRAATFRDHDFLADPEPQPLVVDRKTMANAIRLGNYYLSHALACFNVLPQDAMQKKAQKILDMLRDNDLHHFDRRGAMRKCRSFKTVDEIQPVLDFLEDYGYIAQEADAGNFSKTGRPRLPKYAVNPAVFG